MIVFVAPPFAGHLDRLIPLALAAQKAGYRCHFLTGHRRLAELRTLGLNADSPASLPEGALEAIAEGYGQIHGHPIRAMAQLRDNLALMPNLTNDLVTFVNQHRARLIVADSVALMAGPAARLTGLPWITTIATPLALETPDGVPSYLGGWSPRSGWVGTLRDNLGRRAQRLGKRVVFQITGRKTSHLLPALYRHDGSEAIYSAQSILGFGMTELEFPRSWPPAFKMIGPVHGAPHPGPPLALPGNRAKVFVTLGTHLPWARPRWERDLMALACARPDVHFTYTSGGQAVSDLTAARNLMVVPFADYSREIPRHDAVIHHGGSGITHAAITSGKPSLVVPQDFDQFDYAARIVHHGLGLRRPDLATAGTALDRLLTGCWPALSLFREAALRYRPEETFLETVRDLGV